MANSAYMGTSFLQCQEKVPTNPSDMHVPQTHTRGQCKPGHEEKITAPPTKRALGKWVLGGLLMHHCLWKLSVVEGTWQMQLGGSICTSEPATTTSSQTLKDFLSGQVRKQLPSTSYVRGTVLGAGIWKWVKPSPFSNWAPMMCPSLYIPYPI